MAAPQPIPPDVAERLKGAVDGPVLAATLVDGQLWVVGGDQRNRYRMDLIAAVLDVGGSHAYNFSNPAPLNYLIIIDDAGDGIPANVAAMTERQLLVAFLDPSVAGTGGDTLMSGTGADVERQRARRRSALRTGQRVAALARAGG